METQAACRCASTRSIRQYDHCLTLRTRSLEGCYYLRHFSAYKPASPVALNRRDQFFQLSYTLASVDPFFPCQAHYSQGASIGSRLSDFPVII
eukprot:scaffold1085_cov407-Prasinococcus_capsulatus_cf.AAC.55